MSTKRTAGSGPLLDHEPSFDTEFAVSDEALNARPDARGRAPRKSLQPPGGRSKVVVGVVAGVVVALAAVAGATLLRGESGPSEPSVQVAGAVVPSAPAEAPAPEVAPVKTAPTPTPTPTAKREVAEAPVTKVAPTTIAAEVPEKAPAPKPKAARARRAAAAEEPDSRLDSALAKLGQIEAPPVAPSEASEPAPVAAAPDPGAECDGGKAEACVTFGKKLAAKDFNAALTAFERGCALGSNKGCLEGTRLSEKAGGGEKARELSSIACGRGSATGCRLLASLYQRGVGGAPDPEKAKTFYTKACEAGDTAACGQ